MTYTYSSIPLFNAWLGWSGSIPELFYNVESYEQMHLQVCKWLSKLTEYAETMGCQVNVNSHAISELAEELFLLKDTFADEFEDYYKQRICEWLQNNLSCVIANAVKFVQFGLTDSGRFVAFIPSNWEFLRFDTVMQAGSDFGKLKIIY